MRGRRSIKRARERWLAHPKAHPLELKIDGIALVAARSLAMAADKQGRQLGRQADVQTDRQAEGRTEREAASQRRVSSAVSC